jgi:hypothetical protein
MMKAQFHKRGDLLTIQVFGRLVNGWVEELEKCWTAARTSHPEARFAVDLRGVSFVDHAGERLLRSMHSDGATFQAAGLLVQDVVNHIIGGSK